MSNNSLVNFNLPFMQQWILFRGSRVKDVKCKWTGLKLFSLLHRTIQGCSSYWECVIFLNSKKTNKKTAYYSCFRSKLFTPLFPKGIGIISRSVWFKIAYICMCLCLQRNLCHHKVVHLQFLIHSLLVLYQINWNTRLRETLLRFAEHSAYLTK